MSEPVSDPDPDEALTVDPGEEPAPDTDQDAAEPQPDDPSFVEPGKEYLP